MSDDRFSFPACIIAGKSRLTVDDLLMLRKHAFSDGVRTEEDVRLMLAIHRSCASTCPEWDSFLVESLACNAVHIRHPRGWLDRDNADWLIEQITIDGMIHSPLELEVLLHSLEIALSAPEELYAFALEQMRIGLTPGSRNAYAISRPSRTPGVDLPDLHYLWRVLHKACERGRIGLSSVECEILLAIDSMAEPEDHHPGWNTLIGTILEPADRSSGRKGRWLITCDSVLLDDDIQAA